MQFTSPENLSVHMSNGSITQIQAKKYIVCTGAGPVTPSIRGLSSVKYWTYRDVVQATHVPRSIIIAGAGPLGCEMSQVCPDPCKGMCHGDRCLPPSILRAPPPLHAT